MHGRSHSSHTHNNHNTSLPYQQVIEPLLVHDLVVHLLMYPPPPTTGGRRLPPDRGRRVSLPASSAHSHPSLSAHRVAPVTPADFDNSSLQAPHVTTHRGNPAFALRPDAPSSAPSVDPTTVTQLLSQLHTTQQQLDQIAQSLLVGTPPPTSTNQPHPQTAPRPHGRSDFPIPAPHMAPGRFPTHPNPPDLLDDFTNPPFAPATPFGQSLQTSQRSRHPTYAPYGHT
jgi:hypothetical protein